MGNFVSHLSGSSQASIWAETVPPPAPQNLVQEHKVLQEKAFLQEHKVLQENKVEISFMFMMIYIEYVYVLT
jgi:hypothetical protein